MSEPEYTEEELEQEAERLHVQQALDKLTLADLTAYFSSRDARKREFHAMNYGMGPTKFKYAGCRSFRFSSRSTNCSSLAGTYTEWERTRNLVFKHLIQTFDDKPYFLPWFSKGNVGVGLVYGYDRQSEQKFLSFPIEYAVKKTIEEHYEKANY